MSPNVAAIAMCTPIVASNAIFSARRAARGVDAIDDNPFYAIANFDIAAAQVLKLGRAVKAIDYMCNNPATTGAAETIKSAASQTSKVSKATSTFGKILNFTSNNINPIICVASGIKVLGSEDKVDTAARESLALTTMFGAEALTKRAIGLPYIEDGVVKNRPAYFESQLKAMEQYCQTKKFFNKKLLKHAPGVLKGSAFALASIVGFKIGAKIADAILGEKDTKTNELKTEF